MNDQKTLLDLMNSELQNLSVSGKFSKLERFIKSDKEAQAFILDILKDDSIFSPAEKNLSHTRIYSVTQARARHTAITFLMGLVFSKFENIYYNIHSVIAKEEKANQKLWLLTSLYHDIGYYSDYLRSGDLDYNSTFNNRLFEDGEIPFENNDFSKKYPCVFSYTYQEILQYDIYSRDYHRERGDEERVDHGILGGQIAFDKLVKASKRGYNYIDFVQAKAVCMTIAQHNIFKSQNVEDDRRYLEFGLERLLSFSDFRISRKNVLLSMLSLIDTIECVKRFSKSDDRSSYFETLTVLSSIKANVTFEYIELDFSELYKRCSDDVKQSKYQNHIRAIESLRHWTAFNVDKNSEETVLKIALDKN